MRTLLATAATIVLAGCGATAAYGAEAVPPRGKPGYKPAIAWRTCGDTALQSRTAECGFLTVPMDYADPAGKTIKLAVSRIKHSVPDDKYQGVMLINPGGPGASGVNLSVLGENVPNKAGAAYDWIGFDPRGVGSSQPKLSCDSKYQGYNRPAYLPSTPELERTWLKRARDYAAACARSGGALLDHLRTVDTVRDMESLRTALGAEQINFYGYSYGTYIGQVYATQYPQRVRRMVLDGVVNPERIWYDSNLDQDIAFDRNIKIYFKWLAEHDEAYHLGKTGAKVEKLFYAEQARLAKMPAGGVIGPDELTDVFLQAGYYVFGWDSVGSAFSSWVKRKDPAPLQALFDASNPQAEGSDNGYAIYLGVQCTDKQWPQSWDKWRTDNWRVHKIAPFETWGNAWYNAPCLTWAGKAGKPVRVDGRKVPPILLISETLDAATPFSGSLAVRKIFPRAALIEGVGGTTHAGSLFGNACIDNSVADYLATGELPRRVKANRADKRCKAMQPPDPSASKAESAASVNLSRMELQKQIGAH
ncbi:alpha/beta hydrolase [Amorphoplanes digitatis]|uniref:Pimeloyl-ACP methyl ester carboxylesterase n=1 Tax=Actinoplanes digitatis TaxID=1868 RepID=A0A7W7MUH4_9ACTN|nr:alpha/beta hydrolase [Actinoplanes digitatis]MBB4766792.1 pimeloyl-ACP methyl ester carboxylesterase [Actinoplanes digitatis]GID96392.1 peptidase [Actinoplanes digitatis]